MRLRLRPESVSSQNQLLLTATVAREEALRYTPAGLPVLEMWLGHQSKISNAGFERDVCFEIQGVMLGKAAAEHAGRLQGQTCTFTGALGQRSLKNQRLILHIEHIEFVKG